MHMACLSYHYPQFHIYRMCQNSIVLLCGNAFSGYIISDGMCGTGRIDHLNHYLCWRTDMDEQTHGKIYGKNVVIGEKIYDDRNYRRRHIITSGTQNSTAKRRLSDRIRIYKIRGSYYNYRQ